jgi:glycosyltransferase involved in cell wall biosynthesis
MIAPPAQADEEWRVDPDRLPRLVYFSDVAVENHMHGSALIYRLLETYPSDRLLIVEGKPGSQPDRRLPGVEYRTLVTPLGRLLHTRFGSKVSDFYALMGGDGDAALDRITRDFAPQAVLTVIHGYQWQGAAAYARSHAVPLHVIAHDRWQDAIVCSPAVKSRLAARFTEAYRSAASRFCVSPHMVEAYRTETGSPGEVLYPARRRDFGDSVCVSPRVDQPGEPFTVAYAGSISDGGLVSALALLAQVLNRIGGRLLIFGPYSPRQLAERGLGGDNVVVAGPVSPHELAGRLRAEADVLAASVSFDERIRTAMEMCFPSKLTDYTGAGLPILVHGPPTCSAMRWAKDNVDVAEMVETMAAEDVAAAIERLKQNRDRRRLLAATALQVGNRQFGGAAAERALFSAIADAAAAAAPIRA